MPPAGNGTLHLGHLLIELGAVVLGLAASARVASRLRFPTIPLYLLAGLLCGIGLLPFSEQFVTVGAEIGLLLLLFMLGLESTWNELLRSLLQSYRAGVADIVLNFLPGFISGLCLGWHLMPCVLLGGITYISSSGIASRLLAELKMMKNPETQVVVSLLVFEDLAMAVFLPIMAMSLSGHSVSQDILWIFFAFAVLATVLFLAAWHGKTISNFFCHESDEIILLTTFGAMLLVAGIAQRFQVSAAVGAFLLGIALSGPIIPRTHRVMAPLRDLFAATFFFFSGLSIDLSSIPPVLAVAAVLALITALTKFFTGLLACRQAGLGRREGIRAGAVLIARGEFSLVIAGLAAEAGYGKELTALTAAYVLLLGITGTLLTRFLRAQ